MQLRQLQLQRATAGKTARAPVRPRSGARRTVLPICAQWNPLGRDDKNSLLPDIKLPSLPSTTPTFSVGLSKAPSQATAFGLLSATSVGIAAGALFAPEFVLDLLLPLPDVMGRASYAGLDPTLLRVAGATMIVSAAVEYCLQDAAANNRLTSATYQRLMVACVFKNVGFLLAFAQASPVWTPVLTAFYPSAAVLSILINVNVLLATNRDPATGDQKIPNLVPSLAPTNTDSWIYTAMVVLYLATAAACYGSVSLFTGEEDVSSLLIRHSWAPGFLLAAVASLNLKDAADRGRLGASTFKRLNLGLGLLELTYSAIFAGAIATRTAAADVPGLSNLAFSLAIAMFCINKWAYEKK